MCLKKQLNLHLCLVLTENECICGNRSTLNEKEKTYITSATIRSTSIGVVTGWQDIHHCVAAQSQIRAIHPQPYPIMHIPF